MNTNLLALWVFLCGSLCCAVGQQNELDGINFITRHEGTHRCVYLDTKVKRTICSGLNVDGNSDKAKAFVEKNGGDWAAFKESPACNYKVPKPCKKCPSPTVAEIEAACLESGVACFADESVCKPITEELVRDADKIVRELFGKVPCLKGRIALKDMAFMGKASFAKFTDLIKAVNGRDWDAAASEAEDSDWCREVKETRCGDVMSFLRACKQPPPPLPPPPPPPPPPFHPCTCDGISIYSPEYPANCPRASPCCVDRSNQQLCCFDAACPSSLLTGGADTCLAGTPCVDQLQARSYNRNTASAVATAMFVVSNATTNDERGDGV